MAGILQSSKNAITLRGSTEIVAEFFHYGINSILYQRGLYPPETFSRTQKYGLTLLVSTNEALKTYLNNVVTQVKDWLMNKTVQKLVLIIKDCDTNEVLERWQFGIECDKDVTLTSTVQKSEQAIHKEISAVIRQITASVTFLPLLESACSFDILVYTDKDLEVPAEWDTDGPGLISNSEQVRLRSFSTAIHSIDGMVAYKLVDG